MSYLLVGDTHFSDRPRDAYRFGIFEWIRKQQERHNPTATFILGDVCDKKDNHSALLVNRIANELSGLIKPVYILKGNHDYTDPANPYFDFLNHMPGITFVSDPDTFCGDRVAMIPHCRTEKAFAAACRAFGDLSPPPALLLCHQTFDGAIAETGVRLSGFSTSPIDYLRPRLGTCAGDVHRPQLAGNVVYVGAPYHIRFGDDYDPRAILITDNGVARNLYFDTIKKWVLVVRDAVEITNNEKLMAGDQVKITVELAREEAVQWPTFKRQVREAATAMGLEVFGLDCKVNSNTPDVKIAERHANDPKDTFKAFCRAENVPSTVKAVGECLLSDP